MEYFTYILIILGIMSLCLLVFRETSRGGRSVSRSHSLANSSADTESSAEPGSKPEVISFNANIPIPWGWPGNDGLYNAGKHRPVSESLHRFVDHLISEKQTIENREYLLRRDESLRAMIEDRSGQKAQAKNHRNSSHKRRSQEPNFIPGKAVKNALAEVPVPWGW